MNFDDFWWYYLSREENKDVIGLTKNNKLQPSQYLMSSDSCLQYIDLYKGSSCGPVGEDISSEDIPHQNAHTCEGSLKGLKGGTPARMRTPYFNTLYGRCTDEVCKSMIDVDLKNI